MKTPELREILPGLLAAIPAALAAILPLPRTLVESVYSTHLYPSTQRVLTAVSNLTPLALLDLGLIAVAACWIGLAIRDVRAHGWPGAAGRAVVRTVVWAAVAYLWFFAAWGLNYQRVPLAAKLQRDAGSVTGETARRLAAVAVERANARYALSRTSRDREAPPDRELAAGLASALGDLQLAPPLVARPKRTLLNPYFERGGVSGMTDPFFLETLIAGDLLPVEQPVVIAHEWSHLAGINDEGEANFVAWLACLRGSPADQYSGWLFLYSELNAVLAPRDRATVGASLAEGPRDDLRAIRDRVTRHVSPRVSSAGWRVYDSYLKANRVEAGAASYAGVVRLVLSTTFRDDWRPMLQR
jgi:Protein of unknown function (DUF3810)